MAETTTDDFDTAATITTAEPTITAAPAAEPAPFTETVRPISEGHPAGLLNPANPEGTVQVEPGKFVDIRLCEGRNEQGHVIQDATPGDARVQRWVQVRTTVEG